MNLPFEITPQIVGLVLGIPAGLAVGIFLFALICGDWVNDRNRSRAAQADDTPIIVNSEEIARHLEVVK